ncbi:MAG: RAD55 family ATPase, partial [Thermoplasmata archaeon]|nr:RAD55 family ATPase [Thermoplasmata archaeon]
MADSPVPLGIARLDAALGRTLPIGWLGVVEGRSGSGASLFAKQFAHAGVGRSPVLYYTTYERSDDVARAFAEFGWATEGLHTVDLAAEYYDRVLKRDLEVSRTRERGLSYRELVGSPSMPVQRRTFNLENRLLSDLATIDGPFRLVLDSLDLFLELSEPAQVARVARHIRRLAQEYRGQAILVLQEEHAGAVARSLLEELADLVLELKTDTTAEPPTIMVAVRKIGH